MPRRQQPPADPPSRSTLAYAILGVIGRGPATGYDITAHLGGPVSNFWTARHSQVYPELHRLHADGLVSVTESPGRGPRPTRTYALTDAGRAALQTWVAGPIQHADPRDPDLLQVYNLWTVGPAGAIELLQRLRAHHADQLSAYTAVLETLTASTDEQPTPTDQRWCTIAVLRAGVSFEEHRRDWCDTLLRELADDEG